MIEKIIIISLFVNGLQIVTSKGMLLGFVKDWLDKRLLIRTFEKSGYVEKPKWIYKPLLYCVRCMPSLWGCIIVALWGGYSMDLIWQLPVILISASCGAAVINSLYP